VTEPERQLERRIEAAARRIVTAPTVAGKRHAWRAFLDYKKQRSPARVRALEAARWRRVSSS
jgi:hypothetical protein